MWKEVYNQVLDEIVYKYSSDEKDVVVIQSSTNGKYCSCVMYPNGRVMEYVLLDGDNLSLLKDFSLVKARELGWHINF